MTSKMTLFELDLCHNDVRSKFKKKFKQKNKRGSCLILRYFLDTPDLKEIWKYKVSHQKLISFMKI